MTRLDGLTSLRRIGAEGAALGAAVAAILGADGFDIALLHDSVPGSWFACDDGLCFRVADAVPLHEERIGDAVALLDRVEPLLVRLEQALGLSFEPVGILAEPGEGAVLLSFAQGGMSGALALPPDHPRGEAWLERARAISPAAAETPILFRTLVEGPRIAIAEAGALTAGDLILIAPRPTATIEAAGEREGETLHAGQLDFASGLFTSHPQGAPMAAEPSFRDFAVPLTLRLPERATSAATLAALKPGMALPLGPLTDGMPVELLVAGRPLARGELVQLGDRFAVLIEERSAIDDAAEDAPVELDAEMPA